MHASQPQDPVNFTVCAAAPGKWQVMEKGFEKALAEFADAETAEQYALRLAGSKNAWKVDVRHESGALVATYNSEDDAMPKPSLV